MSTYASAVRRLLERTVSRYAAKHVDPATANGHPPVTRIDLTFSLGDSESAPWLFVCLDTRPEAEADGEWTHTDFARLTRKAWLPAVQAVCEDRKVPVTFLDGKTRKCGDSQLTRAVGEFLVASLLAARDACVFQGLPTSSGCELGVEDSEGEFGWPKNAERGKANLVQTDATTD